MQWWSDYFDDVDTKNPEIFGRWFSEDIVLQFNSEPPIEGKTAVLGFLHEFTKNFKNLRHSHGDLICEEARGAGEAVITFTRLDGAEFAVRGVTMVMREQGLFRRMAIYADFSALYRS